MTDLAGVRAITYFEDDADRIGELVSDNFQIDIRNSINKSRSLAFDQFGYQSIHLVVSLPAARLSLPEMMKFSGMKAEIQIRSLLQHAWAEIDHGVAYKKEIGPPGPVKRRLARIAGLLEIADSEFVPCRKTAAAVGKHLPVGRSEGLTELVPDFVIDIPETLGDAVQGASLFLIPNTTVSNRIFEDNITEVEAYVEEGICPVQSAKGRLAGLHGGVSGDATAQVPFQEEAGQNPYSTTKGYCRALLTVCAGRLVYFSGGRRGLGKRA